MNNYRFDYPEKLIGKINFFGYRYRVIPEFSLYFNIIFVAAFIMPFIVGLILNYAVLLMVLSPIFIIIFLIVFSYLYGGTFFEPVEYDR